jgi:phospholipase/carboxylesterase
VSGRPARGEPEGALVLLHGRGANEHDLVPLLDMLDPERRLAGFTPRAPFGDELGGAHWYRVMRVGYPDPETFWVGLEAAAAAVDGLGIPLERTVLGGFSQGAVMSYAAGLGAGRPRPAAFVCLSGFIPTVPGLELDLSPPLPPIAIGHGVYDDVISVQFAREARERLEQAGAPLVYRESPLPHAVDPEFLAELVPWIRAAVSGP